MVGELIERLIPLPQNYEMYIDDFSFTYTIVKLVKFKMSHETFKDNNVLTLDSN